MPQKNRLCLAGCIAAAIAVSGSNTFAQAATPTTRPDPKQAWLKDYQAAMAARNRWEPKLPAGTETKYDLPYVQNAVQGTRFGSSQTLDLYIPPGKGPFPLIVYIHGGAWKGGYKEQQGGQLAALWVPEGFAVASLDYRFVFDAQFPGMFQDCIDAVAFLRDHASAYRIDADKVGVCGISAGAHIAGLVATAEGGSQYRNSDKPIQAAVLWAGFYDETMETGQWKKGAFVSNPRDDFSNLYPNRTYDPAIARKMSPVYNIRPGGSPILVVHGDQDTTAPVVQSTLFVDALKKAGNPVTYTTYPSYTHNLFKPDVLAEATAFFKKYLMER